ncbi:MAG: permease [Comamonadaceae bacterium PBBC1]|nr:MAG: permease [Comamonadaceae bacterium PBBC1]
MNGRQFTQLVLLSAVWGGSFPLIRVAAPAFGPITMACLRCALAALVLSAIMRWTRQAWPTRQHWRSLTGLGILTLVVPFVLYNWAGLVLPAGYSAVLNATAPMFGVLAGVMLAQERFTPSKLLGCGIGLLGVTLLLGLGPVNPDLKVLLATLACVVAAACYGFGAIFMKRATLAHQALPASAVVHLTSALVLVPAAAATAPSQAVGLPALMALLVLGAVTSGFTYWISMRLMRDIPASASTSSAFLIPLFGVSWGALFLDEPLTPGLLPGVLLILIASALLTGFNPFRTFQRSKH